MSHRASVTTASSLRRITVVTACLALTLVWLAPGTARADSTLVLSSADFSTLHLRPVGQSVGAARAEVGAGLTAGVRRGLQTVTVEACAATGRGQRWSSDAFVLSSASAAGRVLADWRRVHRAQRVTVGAGGLAFVDRSHRRAVVQVLWRDGRRLGLIVLSATRDLSGARAQALSYAVLADSYLKTPLPRTAWGKVMAQVRPNGTVSKQTALEAFALSYGPLPGVHVPSGPRTSPISGDLAYDWVAPYLPRLSRRLRRAIDHAMGLNVGGRGVKAHTADDHFGDPGFTVDRLLTAEANHFADVYAMPNYLDHSLDHLTIEAGFTNTILRSKTGALASADTLTVNADGVPTLRGPYCRIRIAGTPDNDVGDTLLHNLAHEVFHCEEFDLDPGLANLEGWVSDGLAEWAATTVQPDSLFLGWLRVYVTTPHTTLFERTYDAEGFWGHVQDTVPDLWHKIEVILGQPTPDVQYDAAVGSGDDFLETWGSSFFNEPAYAPNWWIDSPHSASDAASADIIPGSGTVIAAPYTTSQYIIDGTEPLERVSISPPNDALLGETENHTDLTDELFCTASSMSDCQCPPGDDGTVPPSEMVNFPAALGVSGDPNGGTAGTVTAVPLSMYCKPAKAPEGGGGGGGGGSAGSGAVAGGSGGDPHVYDFDGGLFDFQQAGEFTLLKSTKDDLDIQVRQQPLSQCCVAFNTAIAMRAGHDTVEVDQAGSYKTTVYVNKAPVHASEVKLGGGAELSLGTIGATVTWPDGTTADVGGSGGGAGASIGRFGAVDVEVTLTHDRFGHVEGLLGNARVPAAREFPGSNGRLYPASVITGYSPHDVSVRYGQFGASWRITQRESLFRYPAGKNTRSYTVPGFPAKYETVASLPAPKRAAAEKACRAAGITSGPALDACVVDVGATGDAGFAGGDARLRSAVLNPVLAPSGRAAIVALGSIADSYSPPRVVVDAAGQGYTSWADGGSGAALDYCRLPQGATSCASRLSFAYPPGPAQGFDSGNAPVFTADGQVALLDGRCCLAFQKFLLLSSDGGQTFTAPTPIVSDDASGMTGNVLDLPPGALFAGSPEQLLTSDTAADGGGGSIQATGLAPASSDPGWFSPAPSGSLSESIGLQGSTLVAVVTNPTSPYSVSWVRYLGVGDPNAASSWSSPQTLSPAPSLNSNAQLAGGPAGIFVARSIATPGDNERLVVQKFTGSGWTSPVAIASDVNGERFAIDQTPAGIVYVIWTNSSGALQYAIATSTAATQFGAPQTLPTRGNVQYPQIAVDAKGVGWATWTNASSPDQAFAVPIVPPPG